MKLKIFIFIFVIFCICDELKGGIPPWPSLPGLTNLAMIDRLMKFYTLRSKSERSELCEKQSKLLYEDLQKQKLWAGRIVDSSAKLQNGITKLHSSDVGYFDECIKVQHEEIKGKYCLARLKTSSKSNETFYKQKLNNVQKLAEIQPFGDSVMDPILREQVLGFWAICVPDGCTSKEVQDHLNTFAGIDNFFVPESVCHTIDTYKSKLHVGDWIVIAGLITLAVVIIVSTVYDLYLYYTKTETAHSILIAFSWFTNFQKITKVTNNPDMLPCLNGIRFISMLWIVMGHQYESSEASPLCVNLLDLFEDWQYRISSMLIIGATVSVDTFFLLSGCLLMYSFLKMQAKKVPFNVPLFYLHRYLRLTPAYAAVIVLLVTVYRFMGSGPFWDPEADNERCKTEWWSSLLYIQNYVNMDKNCIGPTWYLQIDMQLYILSPLLLIPIKKWPKIAVYLLSTLVLIFIIIPTIFAWHYKLAAYLFLDDGNGNAEHFNTYYRSTYTRAGPWILGLMLGHFIFNLKEKKYILPLDRIFVTIFWALSLATMLYIIFGIHPTILPDYEYDRLFNALFIGIHRVLWAAALSWIIFACVFGYGGPVNWFLSLPIFQIFSKLTYSLYLIHGPLLTLHLDSYQMPYIFSDIEMWYKFCGTIITALIIALIWTLTFESPFVVLDTLLMKFLSGSKKKVTPVNTENTRDRPNVLDA